MGIVGNLRRVEKLGEVLYVVGQKHGEKVKIKDERRQKLLSQVTLSDAQKREIDDLFVANYGEKIEYDWHRLYQSFTGVFCKDYFPEILLSTRFEPMVNSKEYRYVLDDKILLPLFCTGVDNVSVPEMIACYSNGVYFDTKKNVLSKSELTKSMTNVGRVIIKPVQDTSSGRGVCLYDFSEGKDIKTHTDVEEVINQYSKDAFIVQKVIRPSQYLARLNPSSINTFRIVTYIWNGDVYHWPVALRIGQGGSYLDNAHAGGMFIGVSDEGVLSDTAYTEFQQRYKKHPDTGIEFDGYELPFVPDLIASAKKMHLNAPQLGLISWDLTVDENGNFVLVEVNTTGQTIWFPQMANGKGAFGKNTEAVLQFVARK